MLDAFPSSVPNAMKIDWHFQGFISDRVADRIVGGVLRLINSVPSLEYTYPIYDHPQDVQVIDGRSYVMKPPFWEGELDKWLSHQQELADTCDTFEEYVKLAQTFLTMTK